MIFRIFLRRLCPAARHRFKFMPAIGCEFQGETLMGDDEDEDPDIDEESEDDEDEHDLDEGD